MSKDYEGILIINKEKGYTSNDVVACLRGILHMKKIGHTGTLDPDAVGVLPVCLGKGTKLVSMMTDMDKEYTAVARLCVVTDTEDVTGGIIKTVDLPPEDEPSLEEVVKVLQGFVGGYDQIPPMYSAKKVNGRKLYELAREGVEIERRPCHVEIHEIEVLSYSFPNVSFRVRCGKGTYIRSLIRDMGEKLKTGAAMESLVRNSVSSFSLDEALTLKEVEEHTEKGDIGSFIKSPESVFKDLPLLTVKGNLEKMVRNGNKFRIEKELAPGEYRVKTGDGTFAAVYTVKGSEAVLKRMFL
ncbi:MAG: tRNA pseudouridine(55) synthase TruB [Lachnospiraceae bacterium]|nr:tRNA pseudouridine(55) synthase TruB [Lachnospiraceae bacterium]